MSPHLEPAGGSCLPTTPASTSSPRRSHAWWTPSRPSPRAIPSGSPRPRSGSRPSSASEAGRAPRPAPRGAPARPRKARRPELDPRQARKADARRVGRSCAATRPTPPTFWPTSSACARSPAPPASTTSGSTAADTTAASRPPSCRCRRASWRSPTSTTRSPPTVRTARRCPPGASSRSSIPTRARGSTAGASRRCANWPPIGREAGGVVPYSGGGRTSPWGLRWEHPAHFPRWPGSCSHPLSRTHPRPTTRPSAALSARCFALP